MNSAPETRTSLLIRIGDTTNQAAWEEFVQVYRPLIIRLAKIKGMQTADADDVAQQILLSVAQSIERGKYDAQRARFRTWLTRVANNAILNALTRRRPDRGSGESGWLTSLGLRSRTQSDSDLLLLESRREIFRWAARQVRPEFHVSTWEAFWRTTVNGESCEAVAEDLGKNRGAIYAARSRIIRRIQEKATDFGANACDAFDRPDPSDRNRKV